MAVRLIPNQLVKLFKTETLNQKNKRVTQDYRQYCQVVREEQTTMFQVQLLPDQESLIVNGDFENDISSWQVVNPTWQFASGRLQGIKSSTAHPYIYQQINTTIGRVYRLRFTVEFVNLTSLLIVAATQGVVPIWAYRASDYGTDEFTDEVYFTSDLATTQITFILTGSIGGVVFIDDVSVERLSIPAATLEDCDGNLIENIDIFAQANDYATFAVEWFGKPDGCYRICLTSTEDTDSNYIDVALSMGTEGGASIELEQGGFLKWYG